MSNFQIKQTPKDFLVEEILWYEPAGHGSRYYIFFEKTNLNTIQLLQDRTKDLELPPNSFAVAGLKDKNATTRQWCSISSDYDLQKVQDRIAQDVTILQVSAHTQALQIGTHRGNHFQIGVSIQRPLSANQIQSLETQLKHISTNGFPNCFGSQRFGKRLRNRHRAKEILDAGPKDERVNHLMLSSFSSLLFNEYARDARENPHLQPGDVCLTSVSRNDAEVFFRDGRSDYILTGPMIGKWLILPPINSPAYAKEKLLLDQHITSIQLETLAHYDLKAYRRPLICYPQQLTRNISETELTCSFSLQAGAFATVLLATALQTLGIELDSQLTIPRRPQ